MKSSSRTANEAFGGGLHTVPGEDQECPEDDEADEQDNNCDDVEDIPEEEVVHQIIQRLTRQLFNIQVNQLSSSTTTTVYDQSNQRIQAAAYRRPRHCVA